KLARDRGIGGPLLGPSAYFMKSPPVQYTDSEAHELVEAFIRGETERPSGNGVAMNGHGNGFSLELDPALRHRS
nr:hypothetical protein [Actinomycetota bacterium]